MASSPLATIAVALLCSCANARIHKKGDYVPQRDGGGMDTHVYNGIEPNDELRRLNFKMITADNGVRAHSAIFAGGDDPTVDIIVAVTPAYASPSKAFTCHLTLPDGEQVKASGMFTELSDMLKVKGLTTGFIKCKIPASKSAPVALRLGVEGANVLAHSLEVKKITDDVQ